MRNYKAELQIKVKYIKELVYDWLCALCFLCDKVIHIWIDRMSIVHWRTDRNVAIFPFNCRVYDWPSHDACSVMPFSEATPISPWCLYGVMANSAVTVSGQLGQYIIHSLGVLLCAPIFEWFVANTSADRMLSCHCQNICLIEILLKWSFRGSEYLRCACLTF